MDQKQKIAKLLSEINKTITSKSREDVYSSTMEAQSVLERFYQKDSAYFDELQYIRRNILAMVRNKADITPFEGPDLSEIKDLFNRLLKSMVNEIKILGLPSLNDEKIDNSIRFSLNQHQIQGQSQTMQLVLFLEFIKNDITGKQFKELQEIAKSEKNPETAKSQIIKKLKSFGENVCANILSNIITNPAIWNLIIQ